MSCDTAQKNIVDFDSLDKDIQDLIRDAVEARKAAYCPYSKFAVGACLQCDDDSTYTGCNVENALLGLSLCAERTAVVKAVSEGKKKYKAIAVIAQQDRFTSPCGPCRQFLSEYGTDIVVYMTKPSLGQVLIATVSELLPYTFSLQ